MTYEEFNKLDEDQKNVAIFEAEKISEKIEQRIKYELFKIDDFFVESKTSLQHQFKRIISTYNADHLPSIFPKEKISMAG